MNDMLPIVPKLWDQFLLAEEPCDYAYLSSCEMKRRVCDNNHRHYYKETLPIHTDNESVTIGKRNPELYEELSFEEHENK